MNAAGASADPARGPKPRLPAGWTADERLLAYPYELYARLQREAPVVFDEELGAFLVSRAADVERLLLSPALSAGAVGRFFERLPAELRAEHAELESFYAAWMVFSEPPQQTKLRTALAPLLAVNTLRGFEERFEELARRELPASFAGAGDLMERFVRPYSFRSVAALLGIAPGDLPLVSRWTDALISFIGTAEPEPERARRAAAARHELGEYLRAHVIPRAADPDAPLLARCALTLSEPEVAAVYAQLITGSIDPVSSALAVALFELGRDPALARAIAGGDIPLSAAVEESLRFSTPFRLAPRVAREAFVHDGVSIPAGARVMLLLAAANRDPARFEAPQRFDPSRKLSKHFAFGLGGHYCLGATLARMQIGAALRASLALLESARPATDRLALAPLLGATTPLELVFEPR